MERSSRIAKGKPWLQQVGYHLNMETHTKPKRSIHLTLNTENFPATVIYPSLQSCLPADSQWPGTPNPRSVVISLCGKLDYNSLSLDLTGSDSWGANDYLCRPRCPPQTFGYWISMTSCFSKYEYFPYETMFIDRETQVWNANPLKIQLINWINEK